MFLVLIQTLLLLHPHPHMIQISQADLIVCLVFSLFLLVPNNSRSLFKYRHAYIASSTHPQITDFRSSSHIAGIKDKFDSLELSDKYSLVYIVHGSSSSEVGDEIVHATSTLTYKIHFLFQNFLSIFCLPICSLKIVFVL